jgi:hypothetical protein
MCHLPAMFFVQQCCHVSEVVRDQLVSAPSGSALIEAIIKPGQDDPVPGGAVGKRGAMSDLLQPPSPPKLRDWSSRCAPDTPRHGWTARARHLRSPSAYRLQRAPRFREATVRRRFPGLEGGRRITRGPTSAQKLAMGDLHFRPRDGFVRNYTYVARCISQSIA